MQWLLIYHISEKLIKNKYSLVGLKFHYNHLHSEPQLWSAVLESILLNGDELVAARSHHGTAKNHRSPPPPRTIR